MLPVKGDCYLTQEYGLTAYARSPEGKKAYKNFPGGIHPGLDYGTHGINLPAISVCDGKVVRASSDAGWGFHVEVEGTDGWRRQYAHLSALLVKVGEIVAKGTAVGKVGSTGASSGVHLHFGNRRWTGFKWEYRDPSPDLADEKAPEPFKIAKKLIKGSVLPDVFVYSGRFKYPLPDWSTKVFLFGDGSDDIQVVPQDLCNKIPQGNLIPSII